MPRGRPKKNTQILESDFNRASPAERTAMLAALTDTQYNRKPIWPRRKATEAQLAALAKARATRAAKKAGTTVAVAVAAPTTQVKKPRGPKKKD